MLTGQKANNRAWQRSAGLKLVLGRVLLRDRVLFIKDTLQVLATERRIQSPQPAANMTASLNLCSSIHSRAVPRSQHVRGSNARTPVRLAVAGGRAPVTAPPDEVDVLVIGSGVGGLSAASLLARYVPYRLSPNHPSLPGYRNRLPTHDPAVVS